MPDPNFECGNGLFDSWIFGKNLKSRLMAKLKTGVYPFFYENLSLDDFIGASRGGLSGSG
jgi:hypothetical protein